MNYPVLVGDIGGTNARFALVAGPKSPTERFEPVRIADFPSIEAAVRKSVLAHTASKPRAMLLAIATPLVGTSFRLTNGEWTIKPKSLIGKFGLDELTLMNDFAAQGLAALALEPAHLLDIGRVAMLPDAPKIVIGPGTGLGIAILAKVGRRWAILPGEGGHVDLGPRTEREMAIWPFLKKENGRMSAENALSGRGLENLFQAICRLERIAVPPVGAAEISALALEGVHRQAGEAVGLFLKLLARVAGDMAILTLARGGVFIAGGIGQKLATRIQQPEFRREFEDKAPHGAIMATVPLFVMTHPTAALEGLSACVRRPAMFSLEGASRRFEAGS